MTEEEKSIEESTIYRFDECVLDADRRELKMAGAPVTLQPKAFDFLLYLVRNRARAVDKDELQDALWPRSIVTETALTRVVMKARRAVGDDAERQSVIRTVHGHGYRFVAELQESTPDSAATATAAPAFSPNSTNLLRNAGVAIAALAVVAVAWWTLSTSTPSGPVRLAVLPVENATGNPEWDWIETGFMALMNRMLEDRGVDVVSGRSISGLAGDLSLGELLIKGSVFQQTLHKTTGFTHLLSAKLEFDDGLYRLTYTFMHGDERPQRRTALDQQPTELVAQAISTVSELVKGGAPSLGNTRVVSEDGFLNEAFARGMSLEFEGKFEEARQLFDIVTEQQPDLFWPRYESALCTRNLREFDAAENALLALRDELDDGGTSYERASASNALAVTYLTQRRNDEAEVALKEVLRNSEAIGHRKIAGTAYTNLGLVARNQGDIELALKYLQQAQAIFEEQEIASLPGSLLNNMSGVMIALGRLEEAQELSNAAIETYRITGKRLSESYALSRLSNIQSKLGLLDEAEANVMSSMAIREEFGDRRGVAISLIYLSKIGITRGDLTRAKEVGQQVHEIGIEIEDRDITMAGLQQIADAELAAGKAREAANNYALAESLASEIADRLNELQSRAGIARASAMLGDFEAALEIANELLHAADAIDADRERAYAYALLGEIYIAQSDWVTAIDHLDTAHEIAARNKNAESVTTVSGKLARAWLEAGDTEKARPFIEHVAAARPFEAENIILQAELAAADNRSEEAARLMTLARNNAGERWTAADAELLERYRADLGEGEN